MSNGAVYFDEEFEVRRNFSGDMVEDFGMRYPVVGRIDFDGLEVFPVKVKHLAGFDIFGVEGSDPIFEGVAGGADLNHDFLSVWG